jgi:hypothetical protein
MLNRLKKNNKGAALLFVLVAVSLVTVLVTTMYVASIINIQMKGTEGKNRLNFYQTDEYMEVFRSIVKAEADYALEVAYKDTIVKYKNYSDKEREQQFKNKFIETLYPVIAAQERNSSKELVYYLENRAFNYYNRNDKGNSDETEVNKNLILPVGVTLSIDEIALELSDGTTESDKVTASDIRTAISLNKERYSGDIILKGVKISYKDKGGYKTSIRTDMRISAVFTDPQISFGNTDISEFLVINDGNLKNNMVSTAAINLTGNICAIGGINIEGIQTVNFMAHKIITNGTLLTKAGAEVNVDTINTDKGLKAEKNDGLWARNIDIDAGGLTVSGNTNVADDLTLLKSKKSYVTIPKAEFKNGTYFGFGYGKGSKGLNGIALNAENSSSVIFNTDYFKLNMQNLDKLVLTGNAFISIPKQGSVSAEVENFLASMGLSSASYEALEGESIAYKGMQQLYLVPGECLGTIGHNPMLNTELSAALKKYYEGVKTSYTETDLNTMFTSDQYLGKYIKAPEGGSIARTNNGINLSGLLNENKPVITNVIKVAGTTTQMVYVYFNFKSASAAAEYMQRFKAADPDTVEEALGKINVDTNELLLPESEIETAGNYVEKTEINNAADTNNVSKASLKNSIYGALLTSLDAGGVSSVTKYSEAKIYARIVEISGMNAVEGASYLAVAPSNTSGKQTQSGSVIENYNIIRVDGNGGEIYSTSDMGVVNDASHPAVLIAQGDVEVNTEFCGLIVSNSNVTVNSGHSVRGTIVASGNVTVCGNTNLIYDSEMIKCILDENNLYKYLKDYIKVLTSMDEEAEKTVTIDPVQVYYENWQQNPKTPE